MVYLEHKFCGFMMFFLLLCDHELDVFVTHGSSREKHVWLALYWRQGVLLLWRWWAVLSLPCQQPLLELVPLQRTHDRRSLMSGCNFSLFKFRLLTSQDSHTHSLSHGNLITPLTPTVLLPPYDLHIKTNTDKNKEHSQLDHSIPELSEDNDNRLVLQKIYDARNT